MSSGISLKIEIALIPRARPDISCVPMSVTAREMVSILVGKA